MLSYRLFLRHCLLCCLRSRLLRRDHIIQFRCYGIQLALQLVDRGAGRGLLRAQMPDRNLLAVAVTEREPGNEQKRHAANQNPAVNACRSRRPASVALSFFLPLVVFHVLFHSRSSSISRLHIATPLRQKPSTLVLLG